VDTSNDSLIASAEEVLNPHVVDGRRFGNVASALVTAAGTFFFGVCIDTGSGRVLRGAPGHRGHGYRG
jgi:cytidine deaminase